MVLSDLFTHPHLWRRVPRVAGRIVSVRFIADYVRDAHWIGQIYEVVFHTSMGLEVRRLRADDQLPPLEGETIQVQIDAFDRVCVVSGRCFSLIPPPEGPLFDEFSRVHVPADPYSLRAGRRAGSE